METVYNYLKSNFHANKVFETIDDLKANTQRAWQTLVDVPDLMKSTMRRNWVVAPDVSEPTSVIRLLYWYYLSIFFIFSNIGIIGKNAPVQLKLSLTNATLVPEMIIAASNSRFSNLIIKPFQTHIVK